MSKHITTMHNHAERLKRNFVSIATNAHLSHAQMMEQRKTALDTLPKKVPAWVRQRAYNYFEATIGMMYRYEIRYCVMEYEGKRYNDFDSLPEDAKNIIRNEAGKPRDPALQGFHYWTRTGVRFS